MPSILKPICGCVALATVLLSAVGHAQDAASPDRDDLFFFRPDTPARRISGALLANRLDRPSLARTYLAELIAAQPDNETLMELRSQFGIATFLKLSSAESLHPESRELLKLINEASRQEAPSAQTVALLIDQLDGSPRDVTQTATRILAAEDAAVLPLLQADPTTVAGRRAAQLLQNHARRFRRGLVQALEGSDEKTAVRILQLLARTGASELGPSLWKYAYTESNTVAHAARNAIQRLTPDIVLPADSQQAAQHLTTRAMELVETACKPFPTATDRAVEYTLAQQFYEGAMPDVFGTVLLDRAILLARDAADLSSAADITAALLVCEVTHQAWPLRWPTDAAVPVAVVPEPAAENEIDATAFRLALGSRNAAAVLQLLARPSIALLLSVDRDLLRECEDFPDPRVRLLTAAVALASGIERKPLLRTVARMRSAVDQPEAVAIDSRSGESRESASVLQAMQYSAAAAPTGVSGFRAAASQLHCDLLLVHTNCVQWSLSQTIANLRADARTATTPIVIYGPSRFESATEALRKRYPGVWFTIEPISELTLPDTLSLLSVTPPRLTVEERKSMIRFARQIREPAPAQQAGILSDGN